MHLDDLLRELVDRGGSDLHLKVGSPPVFRVDGKLVRGEEPPLSAEDTRSLLFSIMTDAQRRKFLEQLELDLSYEVADVGRFRINVYVQRGRIGAAFRYIPFEIKTIDEWGLPQILKNIALFHRGLVLVTGPTGSGKSTTLAAMIDHINSNESRHIITIEDPVEFVFKDNLSVIEQRELGVDTKSFASALRHVMRQSPDVIMVGEMRDKETVALTLTAAETGSLVLATLHTTDSVLTVDRIVDMFPPDQQEQVRLQLAATLKAVISQTLLPKVTGGGRIAAFEILIGTPAVQSAIREGKTEQIYSLIQSGSKYGMQLLDHSLRDLYLRGLVSFEDALAKASHPQEFEATIANL